MLTGHGPLLPKMSEEDLALLSEYGIPRRYPKHSILINKDDEAGGLYIIKEGRVKVFIGDESGSEVILRYQEAGEFFGELALLDERPRTASVATMEETRVVYVSVAHFEQCLRENPDLSAKMVRHLISQVCVLTNDLADCALKTVYQRVRSKLYRLSELQGDIRVIPVRLTHQELAGLVGAGREMVSRVMKQLQNHGYIEIVKSRIHILRDLPQNLPSGRQ